MSTRKKTPADAGAEMPLDIAQALERVGELRFRLADCESKLANLEKAHESQNAELDELKRKVRDKDERNSFLGHEINVHRDLVAESKMIYNDKVLELHRAHSMISDREQWLKDRDKTVSDLEKELEERETWLKDLHAEIKVRDELIANLNKEIEGIQKSLSWKVTKPLRAIRGRPR